MKTNPVLHEAIHEVVENQIRDNDPEETRVTLDRLMRAGYTRHEAIHKIGTVVSDEIYGILKHREEFDKARFVERLRGLR